FLSCKIKGLRKNIHRAAEQAGLIGSIPDCYFKILPRSREPFGFSARCISESAHLLKVRPCNPPHSFCYFPDAGAGKRNPVHFLTQTRCGNSKVVEYKRGFPSNTCDDGINQVINRLSCLLRPYCGELK